VHVGLSFPPGNRRLLTPHEAFDLGATFGGKHHRCFFVQVGEFSGDSAVKGLQVLYWKQMVASEVVDH